MEIDEDGNGQPAPSQQSPAQPLLTGAPAPPAPSAKPTASVVAPSAVEARAEAQLGLSKNSKAVKKPSAPSKNPPNFSALSAKRAFRKRGREVRKVPVPLHRLTPLRNQWMEIYQPIVQHLKLQIRMNLATKSVELKHSRETHDASALQKGADFIRAFILGFSVKDAIAVVRLDDLYIETFEVRDIRSTLKGDHLARAVGRIAGKDGRTKFTIENATKTRIVMADTTIHILGSFGNTRLARNAISSLVLGSAPGKIYNKLRTVSARLNEKTF